MAQESYDRWNGRSAQRSLRRRAPECRSKGQRESDDQPMPTSTVDANAKRTNQLRATERSGNLAVTPIGIPRTPGA